MDRLSIRIFGCALLAASAIASAGQPPVQLAWLHGEEMVAVQRTAANGAQTVTAPLRTPLGSVWKLFMYGYLAGRGVEEPAYRCDAVQRQADDEYCCDPGASIGRDVALARSCGPYFEPARLGLTQADWSRFWQQAGAPPWLHRLRALRPETELPVADLLLALERMPAASRIAARQALLPVSLREDGVLAALGAGPRLKTWSWRVDGERAGGAAGWLADGTPFWLEGPGTSRTVLRAHAGWVAAQWSANGLDAALADAAVMSAEPCIDVDFFRRYPITSVRRGDGGEVAAGPLRGRYVVAFRNGTRLPVEADSALRLIADRDGPAVVGRLSLEGYVARVVDREGQGREVEAARALAIAARTYVLQNASEGEGCRAIADDSRQQRVSPNPPSATARAAAAFTEGLVLDGTAVRYHADRAGPGVMSWQAAVQAARDGTGFEAILRTAYPGAALAGVASGNDCESLPQAEGWLKTREPRWRPVLRAEPGFEPPSAAVRVCQLAIGVPYSDQRRLLVRIREWQSREGRVTLIHEYLHLAFRNHPSGHDERYVERLAQRLADL